MNSLDYKIVKWEGAVNNVTVGAAGFMVTLSVGPVFDSMTFYTSMGYTEHYSVGLDGVIQFLGSRDPLGLAGQWPEEIMDFLVHP